jgi:hypothetical protein
VKNPHTHSNVAFLKTGFENVRTRKCVFLAFFTRLHTVPSAKKDPPAEDVCGDGDYAILIMIPLDVFFIA